MEGGVGLSLLCWDGRGWGRVERDGMRWNGVWQGGMRWDRIDYDGPELGRTVEGWGVVRCWWQTSCMNDRKRKKDEALGVV